MRIRIELILCCLLAAPTIWAQQEQQNLSEDQGNSCPVVQIPAERLPDMNTARAGHSTLFVNGELMVIGGHSNGFVSTSTAEYFSGGRWKQLQMVYQHDDGFALPLQSGKVLIGGGHEKNLGIGQSFEVEMYDPATHSFEGFGCLAKRRSLANAVEIDSGQVVIAGNWYHDDGIEMFNGKDSFSFVKEVKVPRCSPYLFRTSDHDVLVIGRVGTKGEAVDRTLVDRLRGGPFHVPLLATWHLLEDDLHTPVNCCFIGDDAKQSYRYLLPVTDGDGRIAIIEVNDTVFSLLPTATDVPTKGPWGKIHYAGMVMAHRQTQRAYLAGFDEDYFNRENDSTRLYLLCIEYAEKPCKLTLYHTDPLTEVGFGNFIINNDGNIVLTGGMLPKQNYNYTPSKAAYLLMVSGKDALASGRKISCWGWLALALVVGVAAVLVGWLRKRKGKIQSPPLAVSPPRGSRRGPDTKDEEALMQRICQLMESEQPYLNKNLKLSDFSLQLGVNKNYVSACINSQRGCSFSHFVNTCRVEHAKRLLHEEPGIPLGKLADRSGFSSETSFFRAFKTITGKTPREW